MGDQYQQNQQKQAETQPQSYAEQAQDMAQNLLGNSGVLEYLGMGDEPAPPEVIQAVQAPAITTPFDDGGGFQWEPTGEDFTCVGAPEAYARAVGKVIKEADDPDAHAKLKAIDVARQPPVQALPTPPTPQVDNQGALPSLGDLQQAAGDAADWASDTAGWAADQAQGAWDSWWGNEAAESPQQQPTQPAVDPQQFERRNTQKQHQQGGKTDVLDEAIALVDTSSAMHGDDLANPYARGMSNDHIWTELKSGEIDDLDNIKCSEFTSAAMAAAGYDLDQPYYDKRTGLPVAYEDGASPTRVLLWMVVGMMTEATEALMAAQSGDAETVDCGSKRGKELKLDGSGDVLYVGTKSFVGRSAEGHSFGAGAAVVAVGGYEVEDLDRKPGDMQQRLNVNRDGSYSGKGHASIVHGVKGYGIAKLGESGSPTVEGDVKGPAGLNELGAGWYEIEPGSGLKWVIGPNTDPNTVATFQADDIQLIDANIKGSSSEGPGNRGSDATGVGDFGQDSGGSVRSTGRLPTSAWFPWSASDPGGAVLLSTEAPKNTETQSG